jgi:hypothetical protein
VEEIGRHNTTPAGVWGEGGGIAAFSGLSWKYFSIVLVVLVFLFHVTTDHDPFGSDRDQEP